MPVGIPIAEEEVDAMVDIYSQCGSVRETANTLDLSVDSVGRHLKKRGVETMRTESHYRQISEAVSKSLTGRSLPGKTISKRSATFKQRLAEARAEGRAYGPDKQDFGPEHYAEMGRLGLLANSKPYSNLELRVASELEELGYWHSSASNDPFFVTHAGKTRVPDFKKHDEDAVLEIWGRYWHKGENPDDLIGWYQQAGYDCVVLWEDEIVPWLQKSTCRQGT